MRWRTSRYPNERIAATISKSNGGQQVLVMANDRLSTVLASFDYDGVGSANWKTGLPRCAYHHHSPSWSADRFHAPAASPWDAAFGCWRLCVVRSAALALTHPSLTCCALNLPVHRLVVTKKGWTESNEAGDFIEQGEWPRQTKRAVRFSLNKHFELCFENRQNITITYKVRARPHFRGFACSSSVDESAVRLLAARASVAGMR
jgi:hypothetical protein